jgi:hypothetical protein
VPRRQKRQRWTDQGWFRSSDPLLVPFRTSWRGRRNRGREHTSKTRVGDVHPERKLLIQFLGSVCTIMAAGEGSACGEPGAWLHPVGVIVNTNILLADWLIAYR